jgi:MFS family permease
MVGMLMVLIATAHGVMASIPVFDSALLSELHVSRGALKLRDLIQILSAGVCAVGIGYFADRFGVRPIIAVGMTLTAVVMAAYSRIDAIGQIYVLHALLGFCYGSVHVVVAGLLVAGWFPHRRRAPLGVALAGTSLGSAIFPQIAAALLGAVGWRTSLLILGLPPFVMMVITLLVIRERRLTAARGEAAGARESGVTWGQAMAQIASWEFVFLTVAAFCVYYAGSSFTQHSFLYVKDHGGSAQLAATGITVIFAGGLISKIGSGFLAERWAPIKVWLGLQCLFIAGGMTLTLIGPSVTWPALAAIGLGWGGCYTLTQVMIAERFAGSSLGKMIGLFVMVEGVGAGLGSWLTGVIFDQTGGYFVPFCVNGALLMVAIGATILAIRRGQGSPSQALAPV